MKKQNGLFFILLIIFIFISCSGSDQTSGNDNHTGTSNNNDGDYELLPDEYPKPDWWSAPPQDTSEYLFFKGNAKNLPTEEESINEAKNDALSEAARYFEVFFVRKTTSSKSYYESEDSSFYEESFEDAMESYSVVKFKEAKIVREKTFRKKDNITDEIVYDGYVVVKINRELVEPQTDDFVKDVVSATNAFLLKCDILRYNKSEKQIETVLPNDSIYIGDYIKLVIEMNRPRYTYIFNLDNTGKLVAIYPRSENDFNPYTEADKQYQIPAVDTEFFVIEGEASGTEILDFIVLEKENEALNDIVKEVNKYGGDRETYERINEIPVIKNMEKDSFVVREEKESLITTPEGGKEKYNSDDIVSFNPNVRKIVKLHRKF